MSGSERRPGWGEGGVCTWSEEVAVWDCSGNVRNGRVCNGENDRGVQEVEGSHRQLGGLEVGIASLVHVYAPPPLSCSSQRPSRNLPLSF